VHCCGGNAMRLDSYNADILAVVCSHCGQGVGRRCLGTIGAQWVNAHAVRIKAARVWKEASEAARSLADGVCCTTESLTKAIVTVIYSMGNKPVASAEDAGKGILTIAVLSSIPVEEAAEQIKQAMEPLTRRKERQREWLKLTVS
jgi:hypothetical protein